MARLEFSAPLNWPSWVPVTPLVYRKNDRNFAPPMKLEESIRFIEDEINEIGCNGTLSLDIAHPLNERLYKKIGSRVGAVLQLDYMDSRYLIACDAWQQMEHNIYAIHLALRQWRNMERWGIAPLAVLLHGFTDQKMPAAPAKHSKSANAKTEDWMYAMGLGPTATLDDLEAVYHRRAKKCAHDTDALVKLNITMEAARAYFAKKS